jgi:chemotaxis protein histidine kinase CheA
MLNIDLNSPEFIQIFVEESREILERIEKNLLDYEENNNEGCLGLMCNEETNKTDVMFMNVETITGMLTADSWENLKLSIPEGKKLFFVKDEGLNAVFLLYI